MSVTTSAAEFSQSPDGLPESMREVARQRPTSEALSGRPGSRRGRHRHSLIERVPSGMLQGGGWSLLVAGVGVSGLNFVFHAMISRLLGPASFGALGAVLNVITVLAVPLGAVQVAVTQAVAHRVGREERPSLRRLTVQAALWGTVAMAAFWALSPLIDGFLRLTSLFADLAIGIWIPLAVISAVLQGALLGQLRYLPVAIATFLGGGALRLISGAALVSAGFGMGGAVAATLIAAAFAAGTFLMVARRELLNPGPAPVRISLRDAALSIAALAGATTLTGVDVFLARHYLPPVVAGHYAAAAIAGHVALFLPGALITVTFPRLVTAAARGIDARKTVIETLGLVTVIGLAAFAILAGMAGGIVGVLFGPKYLASVSIVWIVALTSVLLGIISLLTYFHIARRSMAALSSWAGVALAWGLVALLHGGMASIAFCMLTANGLVLVAVSLPAGAALMRVRPRQPC